MREILRSAEHSDFSYIPLKYFTERSVVGCDLSVALSKIPSMLINTALGMFALSVNRKLSTEHG